MEAQWCLLCNRSLLVSFLNTRYDWIVYIIEYIVYHNILENFKLCIYFVYSQCLTHCDTSYNRWAVFESSGGDICFNPSTWKTEKGGSWLWGQSGLHSGILSKKMVLADLPGPWQLAYTVHTSMSLLLCLRCRTVVRSMWASLTAARAWVSHLKKPWDQQ